MWSRTIIYTINGLFILDCFSFLFNIWTIRRFLRQVPQLETVSDLRRYYGVVSRCMYSSFFCLIVFFLAIGISIAAAFANLVDPMDFASAWGIGITRICLTSFITIGQEQHLKEIPTGSDDLRGARDEIVRIWKRHPLPRRLSRIVPAVVEST